MEMKYKLVNIEDVEGAQTHRCLECVFAKFQYSGFLESCDYSHDLTSDECTNDTIFIKVEDTAKEVDFDTTMNLNMAQLSMKLLQRHLSKLRSDFKRNEAEALEDIWKMRNKIMELRK